ncbi:copper homeostasis periplasmic binding protein CopC [Halomonas sp. MC140]|nr:copper homeostasis periplasmic binding protein CopC [Halomonas sp. MC140]MDN7132884.1 copper homeostasis periplasmic binding protein CopC [Halomonas sp. MC140]
MKYFSTPRLPYRLLVTLGALVFSAQAMAHAHLESTTPAKDAETFAPQSLEITFSEGLELPFSSIALSDEDGNSVELGEAELENNEMTLAVSVEEPLEPGRYAVEWQVLSIDGHQTEGSFHFTVTP